MRLVVQALDCVHGNVLVEHNPVAGAPHRVPGCCVLLAAQEHAGAVASFDSDVVKAARKLGLRMVE